MKSDPQNKPTLVNWSAVIRLLVIPFLSIAVPVCWYFFGSEIVTRVIMVFSEPLAGDSETCEQLAPFVVKLSKDRYETVNKAVVLVRHYEIETLNPTTENRKLECTGRFVNEGGGKGYVRFYLDKPDKDGDMVFGFTSFIPAVR